MSDKESLKRFEDYCAECRKHAAEAGATVACSVCKVINAKEALKKVIAEGEKK